MPEDTRDETLETVARREALLRALDDEPLQKRPLAARVQSARSTVDRGVRELARAGLVEPTPEGVSRTALGDQLLAEYDRYARRSDAILEARPVLEALPEETTVPTALLLGARVFGPNQTDPYAPLEDGMRTIASADHVRSVVNTALARYADLFEDGLLPAAGRAELCLPARAIRGLLEDRPAWFPRAVDRSDVELVESPTEPPFTAAVVETGARRLVVLGVFDDRGVGRGLVNDTPEAVAWAESYLDRWWDEATVVSSAER
ncbi:hypothetical protein N0B31_05380 [Salinirubellus salinus]|uniref:Uncharacterized protein n=1 Tax=Salinirubellus salinus TaxID=1364945 RepID=A0A9E7R524_9EURY|nr:hypothetical protein [Salinirubellus salinus]UWM55717.1 hypothetical protein N0B31_05380 [Salinirubellus salinus]